MINKIEVQKFRQGNREFYSTILTISSLLDNYFIDYYVPGENPTGYQRPIANSHVKKIVNYLLKASEPIFTTPIIGAINKNDIREENNYIQIFNKLSIVDGQHRLEAFKQILSSHNGFYEEQYGNYEIPVIIIPSDDSKILEIETFVNINNKNKKVDTNLALQLLEQIRQIRQPEIYEDTFKFSNLDPEKKQDIISAISKHICDGLNKNMKGIWYDKIKLGDSNTRNRIISINMFMTSLNSIVQYYIQGKYPNEFKVDIISQELEDLVNNSWEIILKKWREAFDVKYYNIQKGIGVWSLHNILSDCIKEDYNDALNKFREVIERSNVETDDWALGGRFSPYNSKSGFKEIESIIRNEK